METIQAANPVETPQPVEAPIYPVIHHMLLQMELSDIHTGTRISSDQFRSAVLPICPVGLPPCAVYSV